MCPIPSALLGTFISRKQSNVDETVGALRAEGLEVAGCACHVGSDEQRRQLVERALQVRAGDLMW